MKEMNVQSKFQAEGAMRDVQKKVLYIKLPVTFVWTSIRNSGMNILGKLAVHYIQEQANT